MPGFIITFTGASFIFYQGHYCKKAFATYHTDALTLLMLRMLFSLPFYVGLAFLSSNQNKQHAALTSKAMAAVYPVGIIWLLS